MCVIMIADETRPTPDHVTKGWNCNPHGAGIAWRDEVKGQPAVRWIKGVMNLGDIQELVKKTPLPFIVHFRIPTVGGGIPELTHPFPVHEATPAALQGATKGYVMFHNGHWKSWQETMMESAVNGNVKLPVGKWSDSRAMAWIAARHGLGMLELINEKSVVFGPKNIQIFGNGWEEVDGLLVSNKSWCFRSVTDTTGSRWTTPPASMVPTRPGPTSTEPRTTVLGPVPKQLTDGKAGGTSHQPSFRGSSEVVCTGEVVEEEAEAGEAGLRAAHAPSEGNEPETGGIPDHSLATDIYHKVNGQTRSEVQQMINDILSQREAGYEPPKTEAERIHQNPQSEQEWRWAAGINRPHHRQVDPRVETIDQERVTRLKEARNGISRVLN